MNIILALLLALISPLVLLPIEHILNYPYIIEELVKFVAVGLILLRVKHFRNGLILAFLIGALFTVSESVLYLVNFLSAGNFSDFPERLILTGALHSVTCLLIYLFGRKSRWLLIVALIASMFIHYYFNQIVSGF